MSTPPANPLPSLTAPELELMKALWKADRLGARELHDAVGPDLDWAYSTTRTTVERMVGKGLVRKESFHGLNVYSAAISRPRGLARLVGNFAAQVLECDPAPVVSLFARQQRLSAEEIAELEALLAQTEEP